MRNWLTSISVILILILGVFAVLYIHKDLESELTISHTPCLNNGEKWKLAYVEGGHFYQYSASLEHLINGLVALGWMAPVDWQSLPPNATSKEKWNYLSTYAESDFLEFPRDNYWSSNWKHSARSNIRKAVLKKIHKGQIDLILAMGTWAGQDLSNSLHKTPVMVINSINPVEAGIIRTAHYSHFKHVYACFDPHFIMRQVRIFSLLVNFKKLGVVCDINQRGDFYSCLSTLKKAAQQRGFELVIRKVPIFSVPTETREKELLTAYQELAKEVDAMWITSGMIHSTQKSVRLLSPFFKNAIPTWTPFGERGVQNGVLFGAAVPFAQHGIDHALVIAKILNGATPASLIKPHENKYELTMNNATAKTIGFKIPSGLMAAIDKTYLKIPKPEETKNVTDD
jgi:ABC-type uncharacterized transport system substrate-binding protein